MGPSLLSQAHISTHAVFLFSWMFPPLALSWELGCSVGLWNECVLPVLTRLSCQEPRSLPFTDLTPPGRAPWKTGVHSGACAQGEVGGSSLEWCRKGKKENQFDWGRAAEGDCQGSRHEVKTSSVESQGEASVSSSVS